MSAMYLRSLGGAGLAAFMLLAGSAFAQESQPAVDVTVDPAGDVDIQVEDAAEADISIDTPANAGEVAVEVTPMPAPVSMQVAPAAAEVSVEVSGDKTTISVPGAISEAEEAFRRGVALYKRDLYREALTEFNRAITLDASMGAAQEYITKANAKLQMQAAGADPTATPTFERFDPESLEGVSAAPQTADELRRARVQELLSHAAQYMEHMHYATAVDIYEQVLLIEPRNEVAKQGLHEATLGASEQSINSTEREVTEDRALVRERTEALKTLPEGAGPDGIKPHRLSIPDIEDTLEEEVPVSAMAATLDSPVSVEFEDIHINDVVSFIAESWEINIVIDTRAVEPPRNLVAPNTAPGPGGFPGPGGPGGPGAFPGPGGGNQGGALSGLGSINANRREGGGGANFQPNNFNATNANQVGRTNDVFYGPKSDGMIPYINLQEVSLRQALDALLRPLGLDYSLQPGFIWISKPDIIARETFEDVETRFYELRNLGAETLFKVVLRNRFGVTGGGQQGGGFGGGQQGGGFGGGQQGGGFGGGSGGFGGGSGGFGGGSGGFGGGSGGSGGFGGGSSGGFGGSSGGFGGGSSGGFGGGSGGFGGGQQGGFGGGQGGFGGQQGGLGSDVTALSNISDLFSNINDQLVGEPLAIPGAVGLNNRGTGAGRGGQNGRLNGGGLQGNTGAANLNQQDGEVADTVLQQLQLLIPEVYAPYTDDPLSDMFYNPANNMLIVKNTPQNLAEFEKRLAQVDVTPKQVSIEARFLTIRVSDLDKIGFDWDVELSDQNNRSREIEGLDPYDFDINGDGVDEEVPFYQRPDGSNVIRNTITEGMIDALTNPGPAASTFELAGTILDNADGDMLGVTFDYLDSLSETELLSAPRVTTMNRKPAVIADFTTEYFVTSINTILTTVSGGGVVGGQPVTAFSQQVTPVPFNFGISLSVTPQIRDNDQVRLWLNPEVRTRTGEKTFIQRQVIGDESFDNELILPTTAWQAVWTNVIVHDGDTLVLGGLVQDNTQKGEQKMPYIADIPLIGFFFRGKSREVQQSSLLIFVTPDIIDTTGARFFDVAENE